MLTETVIPEVGPEIDVNSVLFRNFSIVIPAYNEEDRIDPVLQDLTRFISSNSLPWNVVIALDGSDGTEDIIRDYHRTYPFVRFQRSGGRRGKGGAIKRVIEHIKGEFVIILDADGAARFSDIVQYLPLLDNCDVINFDRYHDSTNSIPLLRRMASRSFNLFSRIVLGISINDIQSGYKVIRTTIAKNVFSKITITNVFFCSPFFYYLKKMHARVLEVPISYQHAKGSKFSLLSLIMEGFITTILFRIRNSPIYSLVPESAKLLYYNKFKRI